MITVNGITLESWLENKSSSEIDLFLKNEVATMVRKNLKHLPIKGVAQEYDIKPGRCKIYDREEILMEELKDHYQQKLNDMISEAELDRPNRTKLLILSICDENFLTVHEIVEKLDKTAKIYIQKNAASALISNLKTPRKPIMSLIEIKKKPGVHFKPVDAYRIFPPAVKIKSENLAQLCKKKGYSSYTLRDAIIEVPELEKFIADKKLSSADKPEKDNNQQTAENIKAEKMTKLINKSEKITNEIERKVEDVRSTASELKVNVNISFGPIRFLFGIDK